MKYLYFFMFKNEKFRMKNDEKNKVECVFEYFLHH